MRLRQSHRVAYTRISITRPGRIGSEGLAGSLAGAAADGAGLASCVRSCIELAPFAPAWGIELRGTVALSMAANALRASTGSAFGRASPPFDGTG